VALEAHATVQDTCHQHFVAVWSLPRPDRRKEFQPCREANESRLIYAANSTFQDAPVLGSLINPRRSKAAQIAQDGAAATMRQLSRARCADAR
jgi:hypothetical protein